MLPVTDAERCRVMTLYTEGVETNTICDLVFQEFGRQRNRNGMLGFIFRLREKGYFISPDGELVRGARPITPIHRRSVRAREEEKRREERLLRGYQRLPKISFRGSALHKKQPPQVVAARKPTIQYIETEGLPLSWLTRDSCRYILTDDLAVDKARYCAEPIDRKSYCGYHASLCYEKARK